MGKKILDFAICLPNLRSTAIMGRGFKQINLVYLPIMSTIITQGAFHFFVVGKKQPHT